MQYITLDFTGCRYLYGVHTILKEAFHFPEWYGMNLDALWDLLRDFSGCLPVTIIIKGIETMPKDLQNYMNEIFEVFADVHKEVPQMIFKVLS